MTRVKTVTVMKILKNGDKKQLGVYTYPNHIDGVRVVNNDNGLSLLIIRSNEESLVSYVISSSLHWTVQ